MFWSPLLFGIGWVLGGVGSVSGACMLGGGSLLGAGSLLGVDGMFDGSVVDAVVFCIPVALLLLVPHAISIAPANASPRIFFIGRLLLLSTVWL
jgi:hypothetical protein